MTDDDQREILYEGREQTLIKHLILRRYLGRFAHIVGTRWESITYVDCFSGPWNQKSDDFEDSSFSIAIDELRKARKTLSTPEREIELRCFFIEKNRRSHAKLKAFTENIPDVFIETQNSKLEKSIDTILEFIREGGDETFPFIFIDPTGWTGFAMETIRPLLKLEPGEVLINFMTGHIRRFITSPLDESRESFKRLFGSDEYRKKLADKEEQDREDSAVGFYMQSIKRTGGFKHVCCAMILHPEFDRTHFHLIYATRHATGVEVFKEVEKQAMRVMEDARAEAKRRKREHRSGQTELFESSILHSSSHYESLRDRYLSKGFNSMRTWLEEKKVVKYDDAWARALTAPMVWESDIRLWFKEWSEQGLLEIKGLGPSDRVLKRKKGIKLIWMGQQGD